VNRVEGSLRAVRATSHLAPPTAATCPRATAVATGMCCCARVPSACALPLWGDLSSYGFARGALQPAAAQNPTFGRLTHWLPCCLPWALHLCCLPDHSRWMQPGCCLGSSTVPEACVYTACSCSPLSHRAGTCVDAALRRNPTPAIGVQGLWHACAVPYGPCSSLSGSCAAHV